MGQRGQQLWSRERVPIGTVRIRKHSKRCRVRMVKVRDDGPKGRRWITLARALQIPVPACDEDCGAEFCGEAQE